MDRKKEREQLQELINELEQVNGPVDEKEVQRIIAEWENEGGRSG